MNLPSTAPTKLLNAYHPEYSQWGQVWDDFSKLYQGGKVILNVVTRFLRKMPKELPEVYMARQLNFSYTNLLGNILGWYGAALFKTPPQIVKRVAGIEGEESLAKIPTEVADFCEAFEQDADRGGCSFVDFWRQVAASMLLYKDGYVLIDLPGPDPDSDAPAPVSLAQQEQAGLLNPHLVFYPPAQVINWECDAYGNFEWVVIYARVEEQEFLEKPRKMDYWYYFDRTQCALYEREVKKEQERPEDDGAVATLAAGYPRPHALTPFNRVPLRKVSVPDGLWLAHRVYLPLLNHLNLDNGLDFGMLQSCLPQLVIKGSYEDPVVISPVGYHKIDADGDMFFLEPEGKSYKSAAERISHLEERIYRACYLMDQARTNSSTPTAQSGISKEQDKTPSRDALSGIGDVIRPAMQQVYSDVMAIRGFDDIEIDVRGLDFADKATAQDLDLLEQGSVIQVQSKRFEREVQKKAVRLQLTDANPEVLKVIDDEIDSSPTPSEQTALQKEQDQQAMVQKFAGSFKQAAQIGS